jgi:hypothetical protein
MAADHDRAATAQAESYRHMLALQFTLLNIVALALLTIAWSQGLVGRALDADSTHFVVVIAVVFLASLALCVWRVLEASRELERAVHYDPARPSLARRFLERAAGKDGQSRAILGQSLRLELSQRITLVRHLANSLVFLGLIGTVIGFIIALSGVDPAKVGDAENIAPMVSALIQGMSTALVTTLVGGVLNIWIMANYQMLATGTARLINAIVELGEERAGP